MPKKDFPITERSVFNVNDYQNVATPLHINIEIEIIVVYKGVLNMNIQGTEYIIQENAAVVIFPFEEHDFRSINHNNCYVIMFSGQYSDYFFQKVSRAYPINRTFKVSETLLSYLNEQYACKNNPNELFCFGFLLPLFNNIKNSCSFSEKIVLDNIFLDSLVYINNHLTENITEKEIAKNLSVNPVYLSRVFSKHAKMNIKQYINKRRLIIAYSLLKEGATVTDAAYQTGFGSIRNFNRVFKNHYRLLPGDVKRLND